MEFEQRLATLRAARARTSFSFRFEDLFETDEWLNMTLKARMHAEKAFRNFITKHDTLRIPYASEEHIRMRMYNSVYEYNEIKHNFKAYV
ncbi:DUF1413 domain-containing protein [Staphylococcus gallinarum]|uniref:DUF1413 domain-containing protein n=1 Tax=Staphylococcus gallinarum TaxID=1293 RepID=UPI001E2B62E2|nr:DUF1413 domain-containing protein [Staphylococcus gallinarum]MCD8829294.1 single-stranded DNA-binding protein [Staphylococcus gallinarum]MDN6413254.1 DUF1413 domain-containing protein [Staphylococcus gallinarum]MEB6056221.1 single-stranded DNA-binding protein [Staphylococcus gallinarum]